MGNFPLEAVVREERGVEGGRREKKGERRGLKKCTGLWSK